MLSNAAAPSALEPALGVTDKAIPLANKIPPADKTLHPKIEACLVFMAWSPLEAHTDAPIRSGSRRRRFPVAAKTALATAGATGGTPGSPTPPGFSVLCTMCVSTRGMS